MILSSENIMKKLILLICLLLLIPFTSLAGPPSPKFVDNTAYNATSWNGVKHKAPSKDAVRDKIETMVVLEADVILESYLKSVDSPADEDFLTYESTTGDFEWHSAADVADTIAAAISAAAIAHSKLADEAEAFGAGWDGDSTYSQKNDIRDWAVLFDTDLDGDLSDESWSPSGSSLKLTKLTAEPGSLTAGDVYYADEATWDPAGIGIGVAYYVLYDGANWIPLWDEDGDWYMNKIQAKMAVTTDASGGRVIAASEMNGVIYLTDDGPFDVDIPDGQCDAAADVGTWVTVMTDTDDQASLTSNDASNHFINDDLTDFGAGEELDIDGNSVTVICIAAEYWKVTGWTGAQPTDGGGAD